MTLVTIYVSFLRVSAGRLLLVDDVAETARTLTAALTPRGYQVASAGKAEEALSLASDAPPDAIILNPAIAGLDLSTFVRTLRSGKSALVPIVYLASKESVDSQTQGFQLGYDDYLEGAVDARDVEMRVAVAIKLKDKLESAFRQKPAEEGDFSSANLTTSFKGTLDQLGLPSLLSLLDMERKTGVLVLILEPAKEKARINFYDGRVIKASYDKKEQPRNAQLIYELLAKSQGKFEFRNQVVPPKDEIQSATAHLLLEGARLIDEGRASPP